MTRPVALLLVLCFALAAIGTVHGTDVSSQFPIVVSCPGGGTPSGPQTYTGTSTLTGNVCATSITVSGTVFTNGFSMTSTGSFTINGGGVVSAKGEGGAGGLGSGAGGYANPGSSGTDSVLGGKGSGGSAADAYADVTYGVSVYNPTCSGCGCTSSAKCAWWGTGGAGGGGNNAPGGSSTNGNQGTTVIGGGDGGGGSSGQSFSAGGGAWSTGNEGTCDGGAGAGEVIIFTFNLINNGAIIANGTEGNGANNGACNGDYAGGGGGGGAVNVTIYDPTPGDSNLGLINVSGGNGGAGNNAGVPSCSSYLASCGGPTPCGNGGGGGAGTISIHTVPGVYSALSTDPNLRYAGGVSDNQDGCGGGTYGQNGNIQNTTIPLSTISFNYQVDYGANTLPSALDGNEMLSLQVGQNTGTFTAGELPVNILVDSGEVIGYTYNTPYVYIQPSTLRYFSYTFNGFQPAPTGVSCTPVGSVCFNSGNYLVSSASVTQIIVDANYATNTVECPTNPTGTTTCSFTNVFTINTVYNLPDCPLQYTGTTSGYEFSPTIKANGDNTENAFWLVTAPFTPPKGTSSTGVLNPPSDYYFAPNSQGLIGGDECLAAAMGNTLSTQGTVVSGVTFSPTTFPTVAYDQLTFSNVANVIVEDLAYSPEVDGEISNNFGTRTYIFFGIPSAPIQDLWSWSAEISDIATSATSPVESNPVTVTYDSCTFLDTVLTQVTTSPSEIPVSEPETGADNPHDGFEQVSSGGLFTTPVLPYLLMNFSMPTPNGGTLQNTYDIYNMWRYTYTPEEIEPYELDTPSLQFLNVNDTLVATPPDALTQTSFYKLWLDNNSCGSGQNQECNSGSVTEVAPQVPGWTNPNVAGPISVAVLPDDYIIVLNETNGGDYYLTVLRIVSHGQYNDSSLQPNSVSQAITSSAQWTSDWNAYFANAISLQDQQVYVTRSIDLSAVLSTGPDGVGGNTGFDGNLFIEGNAMFNDVNLCGSSADNGNPPGNWTGTGSGPSPSNVYFLPLNISADAAGDVFITGIVNGVNAYTSSGAQECNIAPYPGLVKVSNVISGNPYVAANTTWIWSNDTSQYADVPVLTEIAAAPDGGLVFAANQTNYLNPMDTGYIYSFAGSDLSQSSSIDLTYTWSPNEATTGSSSGGQPVNINAYLENGGFYGVKNDFCETYPGLCNNVLSQEDGPQYHHPLGLSDVNGYLYVLDNWGGGIDQPITTLSPEGGPGQTCKEGGIWSGQCFLNYSGVWFDELMVRALNSNGTDAPLNPTPYMDIGLAPNLSSGAYPPYGWMLSGNFSVYAGNAGGSDELYQLATTTLADIYLGGCGDQSPPEYAPASSCDYNVGSTSCTGSTGDITFNACSTSTGGCSETPQNLPGSLYTGVYYPVGPMIDSVGPFINPGTGSGVNGGAGAVCSSFSDSGIPAVPISSGTIAFVPLYYGVAFSVGINGTVDVLLPHQNSFGVYIGAGAGQANGNAWAYTINGNPQHWNELVTSTLQLDNYTKPFGGPSAVDCYSDRAAYSLPNYSACNYLEALQYTQGPVLSFSDPVGYAENLGSPTLLTAAGVFSSTYSNIGSIAATANLSSCTHPNFSVGTSGCPSFNISANLSEIKTTLPNASPLTVLYATPQETISTQIQGYILVPYSYTYTVSQQIPATGCSSGFSSMANTATGTLYTYAVVDAQSNRLASAIEGADTYLEYSGTSSYYEPNLSDIGTILPPDILFNIKNDRLFGAEYVNLTQGITGNEQAVLNASTQLNYNLETYQQTGTTGTYGGYQVITSSPITPVSYGAHLVPGNFVVAPGNALGGYDNGFMAPQVVTSFTSPSVGSGADDNNTGILTLTLSGTTGGITTGTPLTLTVQGLGINSFATNTMYAVPSNYLVTQTFTITNSMTQALTVQSDGTPAVGNYFTITQVTMSGVKISIGQTITATVTETFPVVNILPAPVPGMNEINFNPNPVAYGQEETISATCPGLDNCAIENRTGATLAQGQGSASVNLCAGVSPQLKVNGIINFTVNDLTVGGPGVIGALTVLSGPVSPCVPGTGSIEGSATYDLNSLALPSFVNLFDLYKETVYNSPLYLFMNGGSYAINTAPNGQEYNNRGYQRIIYSLNDRFNNTIIAPLDADIANITTVKFTEVQPAVSLTNANQTVITVNGVAGYYTDFGTIFVPLNSITDGPVYLYYDENLNIVHYTLAAGANLIDTQLCAFNRGAAVTAPYNLNCTTSNPVWTGLPPTYTTDNLVPNSQVVSYYTSYNGASGAPADTCINPPTSLFEKLNLDCNIFSKGATDSCPLIDGVQSYCASVFANGSGTCTTQEGLVGLLQTAPNGTFGAQIPACGIGSAVLTAWYYGANPPEPLYINENPLSQSADPSCTSTNPQSISVPGNEFCSSVQFIGVNYIWAPNTTSTSVPIGLLELGYGSIGPVEIIGLLAVTALIIAWRSRSGTRKR